MKPQTGLFDIQYTGQLASYIELCVPVSSEGQLNIYTGIVMLHVVNKQLLL